MEKQIRVRFAPSPTGYLHIGGLRTALYNYLFAKKNNGTFILRIEDTDQKRFVEGAIESLITSLETTDIHHDEGVFLDEGKVIQKGEVGPYIQSERLSLYKEYAEKLLNSKRAYYCFCTPERLHELRAEQTRNKQAPKYDKHCLALTSDEVQQELSSGKPYVIRLDISEARGVVLFDDMIRGQVSVHARDIDDQVLIKSDGFPTGTFAIVVDDILMGITHVIKGEEWLPTTPKQVIIYEALSEPLPQFAHLPLLLNLDKSKLSKRQGDVAVEDYLEKGYLKEALVNFVALLGWNPGQGNTQEIFTLDELVQVFDLSQVHKAGAVFDLKKLDWMNGEYIKKLSIDELYERAVAHGLLEKDMIKNASSQQKTEEYLKRVLTIERDRLVRLVDIGDNNPFFFISGLSYDTTLLYWKQNTPVMTKEALEKSQEILSNLTEAEWSKKEVLEKILLEAAGDKKGDLLWPLRVALTGAERSPSPFEVAWVLGKEESLKRLERAIERLE